jgi:hypothetical protein
LLSSSGCHTFKEGDRKDLTRYFNEAAESLTELEILCTNYFRLNHCTALKRDGELDPFHLATNYLQQRPKACWEDIVEVFCEQSKHALALMVAEQHDVNKKHCLKA